MKVHRGPKNTDTEFELTDEFEIKSNYPEYNLNASIDIDITKDPYAERQSLAKLTFSATDIEHLHNRYLENLKSENDRLQLLTNANILMLEYISNFFTHIKYGNKNLSELNSYIDQCRFKIYNFHCYFLSNSSIKYKFGKQVPKLDIEKINPYYFEYLIFDQKEEVDLKIAVAELRSIADKYPNEFNSLLEESNDWNYDIALEILQDDEAIIKLFRPRNNVKIKISTYKLFKKIEKKAISLRVF